MALYDFMCLDCNVVVEDIYAQSYKDIEAVCPECRRPLQWKPFVRTQSTKADFQCVQAGRRFHSYNDLERWARDGGKAVVPTHEYERNHLKRYTTEERFMKRYDGSKVREAVKKSHYRLKHGYHPKES